MRRHVSGVVALAAAGLCLAVAAAVGDLTVAGSARVPGDAVMVGQCLGPMENPREHPVSDGTGQGGGYLDTAAWAFPAASRMDCAQPHPAQLISIDYSADRPAAATLASIHDADVACQKQVDVQLSTRGIGRFLDHAGRAFLYWAPAVNIIGQAVGPGPSQRAAGARWAGCAISTLDNSPLGTPASPLPGQCLSVGSLAELAATRPDGTVVFADPTIQVPCSSPHPAQVLAWVDGSGGTPAADEVRASCQRAARRFLGVDDITADGRLRVDVVSAQYPVCIAVTAGNRTLDDSLLGIGAQPLPWTN